jgi:hypothetical protein
MTYLYPLLCDGSHLDNTINMCHFGLACIWACLGRRMEIGLHVSLNRNNKYPKYIIFKNLSVSVNKKSLCHPL